MADWRSTATIPGFLAVAAMLALLSPGVTAVRADEAAASGEPPRATAGASCQAGSVEGADDVLDAIRRIQEQKARELAARPPRPPADGDFVVLNGRGYNYGTAPLELPSPRELSDGR